MKPGERVQLLRQLAEHINANEDWTHTDLILKQFGFRPPEDWNGPQYEYVLQTLSDGREADLLALHEFLFGFSGAPAAEDQAPDLWPPDGFRLFLSHVSGEKEYCSTLKAELAEYGIAAFLAHEDIKATREWIEEIERALSTCHALAAALHSGFKESNWTDQEVGFCHGRRSLIVPIRLDLDPYGFISRYQAVNGRAKTPRQIADELFRILVKHPKTSARMSAALVRHFEESVSFAAAKRNVEMLRDIDAWTPDLLRRLEGAETNNSQVRGSWGVPGRIQMILREHSATYGGMEENSENEPELPF